MCSVQGFILLTMLAVGVGFTLVVAYYQFLTWKGYRFAKKQMKKWDKECTIVTKNFIRR